MLAFPNTYFSNLNKIGKFDNLSSVFNEVKAMLDPKNDPLSTNNNQTEIEKFGASDVFDLNWFQLLNAYTCSEIKIFHYELVGLNIGQPRCVFDAEGLIDYETAVEDVERVSPHMF